MIITEAHSASVRYSPEASEYESVTFPLVRVELPVSWKKRINPYRKNNISLDESELDNINPFRQVLIDQVSQQGQVGRKLAAALRLTGNEHVFRCWTAEGTSPAQIYQRVEEFGTNTDLRRDNSFWYDIGQIRFSYMWSANPAVKGYLAIYRNDPDFFEQDNILVSVPTENNKAPLKELLVGVVEIAWQRQ